MFSQQPTPLIYLELLLLYSDTGDIRIICDHQKMGIYTDFQKLVYTHTVDI